MFMKAKLSPILLMLFCQIAAPRAVASSLVTYSIQGVVRDTQTFLPGASEPQTAPVLYPGALPGASILGTFTIDYGSVALTTDSTPTSFYRYSESLLMGIEGELAGTSFSSYDPRFTDLYQELDYSSSFDETIFFIGAAEDIDSFNFYFFGEGNLVSEVNFPSSADALNQYSTLVFDIFSGGVNEEIRIDFTASPIPEPTPFLLLSSFIFTTLSSRKRR